MKYTSILTAVVFTLLFTQCVSDKVYFQDFVSESFSYDTGSGQTVSTPINKRMLRELLSMGMDEECALRKAYEVSSVRMKRNLPHKCHHQFLEFNEVEARYKGDTLSIELSSVNKRTSRVLKTISVQFRDNTYYTEVKQGRGQMEEVYDQYGRVTLEPIKKSAVQKHHILLDKEFYNVGDTLHGTVKIESIELDRMGRPAREYVKGEFRTIIADTRKDCNALLGSLN